MPHQLKVDEGKAKPLPPREHLLSILDYNPLTGDLVWKYRDYLSKSWNTRYSDKIAGHIRDGYIIVSVDGVDYKSHRLIWLMVTGEDPGINTIDHKDTIRSNNKWDNLRLASFFENSLNKSTKLGKLKNIETLANGKFRVRIHYKGVRHSSKSLESVEQAIEWRDIKLQELHGEFASYG